MHGHLEDDDELQQLLQWLTSGPDAVIDIWASAEFDDYEYQVESEELLVVGIRLYQLLFARAFYLSVGIAESLLRGDPERN